MPQPISFSSRDLERELAARTDADSQAARSLTAKRDLERYYETLRRSLPALSEPEAALLADVNNGTLWEPHAITLLWANVADAAPDGVADMWDMTDGDFDNFVQRLRRLSYAECLAIVDAIERFWLGPYRQEGSLADRLRAVGLLK